MADYEDRGNELAERFAKMDPTLPTADAEKVTAALKRHASLRSGCLEMISALAEDKGDDPLCEPILTRVDQSAKDVLAVLNGMLDGIENPSPNLRAFRDIAASEESKFFDAMKRLNCGKSRDQLMRYCHELESFVVTLRAKWQNLSGTEKALLQKERLYAGQMRETMKQVYEGAVPEYLTSIRNTLDTIGTIEKVKAQINDAIKNAIKEYQEKKQQDPTLAMGVVDFVRPGTYAAKAIYAALTAINAPASLALQGLGKAAAKIEPFVQYAIDQQVEEVKSSLNCARTVIVTFSQTRRQAYDYVRNNGYSVAKQYLENARKELAEFIGAMPSSSPALRTEAELFARYVESAWIGFVELMRIHHDGFVREFQGIFVDSVSDQTLNDLTDRTFMNELANGINAMDLDQKLSSIYDNMVQIHGDLDRAFGSLTNFNEFPYEAQAILQAQIREFESNVRLPFTQEMKKELARLDAAKGKRPRSIMQHLSSLTNDLVQDSMREAGASSSG
jgi:hypothetical protein